MLTQGNGDLTRPNRTEGIQADTEIRSNLYLQALVVDVLMTELARGKAARLRVQGANATDQILREYLAWGFENDRDADVVLEFEEQKLAAALRRIWLCYKSAGARPLMLLGVFDY